MSLPDLNPAPSRRDRELALFGLAATDPARAADAFLARQTPVWPALLESLARRFDPDATGFVRWPGPTDDLFPELAHPGTVAPDAAILLSNEARTYLDATPRFPDLRPASDVAQALLQDTDSTLLESLWDAEDQCLLCTTPDGFPAADATVRSLFPLVWRSLPRTDGDAVSAASAAEFPSGGTPAAWILLVAFLSSTPYRRVFADLCRRPLPPSATPAETEAHAALVAALAPSRPTPRSLARLAAHPLLSASAAIALLAIGFAMALAFRSSPPSPLSLGHQALDAASRGDFSLAASLYSQAAEASPAEAARLSFAAANALFRAADYPAAEAAYRAILDASPDTPSAALNLALSLLRQNRHPEAIALYRQIAGTSSSPAAAARAAAAADYLSALP